MHQRFHGLASMANPCRAFSTKHYNGPAISLQFRERLCDGNRIAGAIGDFAKRHALDPMKHHRFSERRQSRKSLRADSMSVGSKSIQPSKSFRFIVCF